MTKKATATAKKAANTKPSTAMEEAMKKATEEALETTAPVEDGPLNEVFPSSVCLMRTANGPTLFVNPDIVGDKLIDIMAYVLDDPCDTFVPLVQNTRQGHGMNVVDFRMDGTVGQVTKGAWQETQWYYWMAARTAGCNIVKCVEDAFEAAIGKNANEHAKNMNIEVAVWQNMLQGFLHELHHSQTAVDYFDELALDAKFRSKEEEDANNFASQALMALAKQVDIEPELTDFVKAVIYQVGTDLKLDESKDPNVVEFAQCQDYMQQTGDAWIAMAKGTEDRNHVYGTFRELLHAASGEEDVEEWTKPVGEASASCGAMEMASDLPMTVVETPVTEQMIDTTEGFDDDDGSMMMYDDDDDGGTGYEVPGFQGVQQQQAQHPQTHQVQQQGQGNPGPIASNAPNGGYQANAQQTWQTPTQNNEQVNPNAQVGAGTYERPNMDMNTFQATVNGLYRKLYNHLFNVCQFNPCNGPGQPFFHNANAIKQQIVLTPEENEIVKEMDTIVNVGGNEQLQLNVPVNGWISGRFIDRAGMLPGFVLAMTDLNGNRIMRKFLPQNPWKSNEQTGQWSGPAVMAQQGNRMAWVLDPLVKTFERRLMNGTLEFKEGRNWVARQVILTHQDNLTQAEANHMNSVAQG